MTPPAAPTADDYRAALALIDRGRVTATRAEVDAIVAVARAAVDKKLAYEDYVTQIAVAACEALDAAVADLVALARATAAAQGGGE